MTLIRRGDLKEVLHDSGDEEELDVEQPPLDIVLQERDRLDFGSTYMLFKPSSIVGIETKSYERESFLGDCLSGSSMKSDGCLFAENMMRFRETEKGVRVIVSSRSRCRLSRIQNLCVGRMAA